jgi:hypothetical protein
LGLVLPFDASQVGAIAMAAPTNLALPFALSLSKRESWRAPARSCCDGLSTFGL